MVKEIVIPSTEPKFKVGDMAYRIRYRRYVSKDKVRKVDYREYYGKYQFVYIYGREQTWYPECEAFATEEEAEVALIKMKTKDYIKDIGYSFDTLGKLGIPAAEVCEMVGFKDVKLLE